MDKTMNTEQTRREPSAPQRPQFRPSRDQIDAAEMLIAAMAIEQATAPLVLEYQKRLLAEGQWRLAPEWVQKGTTDQVILDPNMSFLLSEQDAQVYLRRCGEERRNAGLSVSAEGNCPLLEAQELVRQAKHHLVKTMDGIGGLNLDRLIMLPTEKYEEAVDLMLRLLAPFADPHTHFGIPKPAAQG
jgi:hypothetical protein